MRGPVKLLVAAGLAVLGLAACVTGPVADSDAPQPIEDWFIILDGQREFRCHQFGVGHSLSVWCYEP